MWFPACGLPVCRLPTCGLPTCGFSHAFRPSVQIPDWRNSFTSLHLSPGRTEQSQSPHQSVLSTHESGHHSCPQFSLASPIAMIIVEWKRSGKLANNSTENGMKSHRESAEHIESKVKTWLLNGPRRVDKAAKQGLRLSGRLCSSASAPYWYSWWTPLWELFLR